MDPNQPTSPIDVHVYVGDAGYNIGKASVRRDDVAKALPGYGSNHGYNATLTVPAGKHRVCAYGINTGPGSNQPLKECKEVVVAVPPPVPPKTSNPSQVPPSSNPTATPIAHLRVKMKRVPRSRVRINWPNVPGATHYEVRFSQAGTTPWTHSTPRSRLISKVRRGTPFTITVSAMQRSAVLARSVVSRRR